MSSDDQTEIPPSFLALFMDARGRLGEALRTVYLRYDTCEDLAQMLVQRALLLHATELPGEEEILRRMHHGLTGDGAVVSPTEARWVVRRLAELLNWPDPGPEDPASTPEIKSDRA